MKRVKVGQVYVYRPVGWDLFDRPQNVNAGDVVVVRNLPGCPPANTMGHCYVMHPDGKFGGLVLVASLQKVSR